MCSLHKSKLRSTSVVRRLEICPSNCFKSWTIQHHPLIISYDLVCVIQNTRLLSMILEQGLVYAIIEETWPTLRLADICSVGKSGIWCNIPASSVNVYVFVSWRRESKFTLGLSYFLILLELTQVVTIVEFPKPNISDISVLVKTTFSIK